MIRLGSVLAITDTLFVIPNAADNTKMARFSTADMPTGVLHTYVLPSNGAIAASDTLVTLGATQTLNNKTLNNATFTGTLTVETVQVNGNTTLGDSSADSLTINAASTFSASATFANTLIAQQTLTVGSDMTVSGHIDMADDKYVKLGTDDDLSIGYLSSGDASFIINTAANGLNFSSDKFIVNNNANTAKYFEADSTNSIVYHNNTARITTSATGINIGGSIDAVTSITGSGDIAIATDKFTLASSSGDAVFGGNVTANGTGNSQVGSSSAAKLGVGRAPTTYNLEVEGSIYATGSSIICGDTSSTKFILQKRVAGIGLHFTDDTGTDQMVLNSGGDLGVGKNPSFKLDVSGNSNIDGDLTIVTTNPASNTGGKISAREIVLSDPQTGSSATLNASTTGGVSRAKVYFHSFN